MQHLGFKGDMFLENSQTLSIQREFPPKLCRSSNFQQLETSKNQPCCCLAWYLRYVFQMFSRFAGKKLRCTTDTWVETQGSWVQAALAPNWNLQILVFGWIIMLCHLVSTFGPRTPLVCYTIQYTRTENSVVNCQLAVPATSLPLCLFDTWVSRHVAHGSKVESAWVGGSTTESSSKSCQSVAEPARCTVPLMYLVGLKLPLKWVSTKWLATS